MNKRKIENRIYDINRQLRSGAIDSEEATRDYLHITTVNDYIKDKLRGN